MDVTASLKIGDMVTYHELSNSRAHIPYRYPILLWPSSIHYGESMYLITELDVEFATSVTYTHLDRYMLAMEPETHFFEIFDIRDNIWM